MEQIQYQWNIRVYRSKRKTVSIEIKPHEVIVRAPLFMSDADIQKLIDEKQVWIQSHQKIVQDRERQLAQTEKISEEEIRKLSETAKRIIPQKVRFYAEKIGVEYGKITVRCQKTRWGSCSSKGNLNFNCLLMLFPDAVIDSVVVHELCHRKHMDHSPAFYNEVRKVFPEYDVCHLWLKKNGSKYMYLIKKD